MIDQSPVDFQLDRRFEVLQTVSEARFSSVYQCRDRELDRLVAVKVSALDAVPEAECRRLIRELHVSCKLRHPGIASAFDGLRSDTQVVLIMPWLGGGTLCQPDLVPSDLPAIRQTVATVEKLCQAVAYLHGRGIVHGDIKPDNVLLDDAGAPHLADFGSCQSAKAKQASGTVVGTAAFLAPEVVSGESSLSVSSDLYAIGATLFTALCGRPPFEGDDAAVMQAVRAMGFPDARRFNPAIPRPLQAILHKACAAEPAQRYPAATDLAADLVAWSQNRPLVAQPPNVVRRVALWSRRHQLAALLLATLTFILMLGTASSFAGWSRATTTRRQLEASQTDLTTRGQQARRREAELQATLREIEAEQERLQESLDEEAEFTANAQQTKQRSEQLAELAQQRLQDAETAAQSLLAAQQQIDATEQELQTAEQQSQSLQAFTKFKQQRIVFNEKVRQAFQAINEGRPVAAEWLEQRDEALELEGTLPAIVRFLSQVQTAQRHDHISPAQRMPNYEIVQFDPAEPTNVLWMNAQGLNRLNMLATDYKAAFSREINPVVNQLASRLVNKEFIDLRFYPNGTLLLRPNQQTGDVEVIYVSNQDIRRFQKLWSCRDARQTAAQDQPLDAQSTPPLTPYLLDVGTDPQQHLVLLSTDSSDPARPARTFLHSLDLRELAAGGGGLPVKTFDMGVQRVHEWPQTLQLSEHFTLGIGCRLGSSADEEKKQIYSERGYAWLRFPSGTWQALGSEPKQETQGKHEDLLSVPQQMVSRHRGAKPYFARGDGRVLWIPHWGSRVELHILDCVTGETLVCSTPTVKGAAKVTAVSPQLDRWLLSGSRELKMMKIADLGTEHCRSLESFESLLPRLRRQVYKAPATVVAATPKDRSAPAPNKQANGIQANGTQANDDQSHSRKGIRFGKPGSGFAVSDFSPAQDQPWTFEIICRVDAVPADDKNYRWLLESDILRMQIAPGGRLEVARHKRRDDGTPVWLVIGTSEGTTERWLRFTACWDGKGRIYHFIDGQLIQSRQIDESLTNQSDGHALKIGMQNLPATIDAVRVRRGIFHTASFDATQPLDVTDDTVFLFHFDEGQGKVSDNAVAGGDDARAWQPQWVKVPDGP